MRQLGSSNLGYLGIELDEERNKRRLNGLHEINKHNSRVRIIVISTNEELEIALQCYHSSD